MSATVVLIDYGSGNLRSAANALTRAAETSGTRHEVVITADPNRVAEAERIVLPGVGAFADCMHGLSVIPGMLVALDDSVIRRGAPFLGICVGMQLLADWGREHKDCRGLGWIPGEVVRIAPLEPGLKIPHMGWNSLSILQPHKLFEGMADGTDVYFVHSYYLRPREASQILATTEYGGSIPAVVGRDNIAGTQFHPEKSQAEGLSFLERFLNWHP
jgi:imidazole glycerol-phosphate synthase subunit HisH